MKVKKACFGGGVLISKKVLNRKVMNLKVKKACFGGRRVPDLTKLKK
jgi:hypothetical protein